MTTLTKPHTWSPILQGTSLQPSVWSRIEVMRSALLAADNCQPFPWQAALFFAYLGQVTGAAQDRDECERLLQMTRHDLPTSGSLYEGLAGVGWVFCHLRTRGFGEKFGGLLNAIDRALEKDMRTPPDSYELLYGVAGTALYALERGNQPLLEQAVGWLERLAWQSPDGLSWPVPEELLPEGASVGSRWDLGVAHGVLGVLFVLNEAVAAGVHGATRLRDGVLPWLQARRSTTEGGFPRECGHGLPSDLARQGWCYGDVSAACVLANTDDMRARQMAHELAQVSIQRPEHLSRVKDEWFCHGRAGLAHLYARLSTQLDASLEPTARQWYERLLEHPPESSGLHRAARLLEGAVGEGLVLLSSVTSLPPDWDRLLGCSRRPWLTP